MTLISESSKQVPEAIKDRGRQYFLSGAVEILEGDTKSVLATVQGTQVYDVILTRKKKKLGVSCSCPYFDENGDTCKHIWATILTAESRGMLRGSGPLYLEPVVDQYNDELQPESEFGDWDLEDDDEWESPESNPLPSLRFAPECPPQANLKPAKKKAPSLPNWKKQFAALRKSAAHQVHSQPKTSWPAGREIIYVLNVPQTLDGRGLAVQVHQRERKMTGEWSKPKLCRVDANQIATMPDPADKQILTLMNGSTEWSNYSYSLLASELRLSVPQIEVLLPMMCQTGRCGLLMADDSDLVMISWDGGGEWEFWLQADRDEASQGYRVKGALRSGDQHMDVSAVSLVLRGGFVFWENRAAKLQDHDAFDLLAMFRKVKEILVPFAQATEFIQDLFQLEDLPRLDLPEELRFEEVEMAPRPRLRIRGPENHYGRSSRLTGDLSFGYEGQIVPADSGGRFILQGESRRLIRRDRAAESAAAEQLRMVGFRQSTSYYGPPQLQLAARNLPRAVTSLVAAGWHVEAEGKLYRQPGAFHVQVQSGVDWFELNGTVDYGDTKAKLPDLLAALKRGENIVRLDDGSFGMLPEEWLKKYGVLAGLGSAKNGELRFQKNQVGLLDVLLASQSEISCDEVFTKAREELRRFAGIQPADPAEGFTGQLRGYQRDGLGWLNFLQKFGFGGCLADDMGLGKTVQVLALLEYRRMHRGDLANKNGSTTKAGPCLVVVPRSLVFNWKQEAERFTPNLRILDHTGMDRLKPGDHFQDYDLVITTYGTLRRDALLFKDVTFDYCILDESQAVKNARTESAKAVRLIRADHRLALSGTPVENHLGELWSLFDFLNPGMLGTGSVFQLGGAGARNPSEETRSLLARALRPLILRRTKEQVAKDLPQKLEQTIYCELEPAQRKLYNELRDHYRQALLARIERESLNKFKIQVLEALLRLRQAACHPGLIDKNRVGEPSAKLDTLLPQIEEVLEEGHKMLVFSQFTSLLAIVRERLHRQKISYEYLDGKTKDRAARVERFQNDPDRKLFLISLKAGGLGLNLTAAEYVVLLDPWWNPAVEAQAIDRAHRIGQTRQVFAYRLIAKDTVEEKVLELQQKKRDLADAIINADDSLIRNLVREDLELLLS